MPDRRIAPPITNAIDFDFTLPVPEKKVLSNGVVYYLLEGGAQEVMNIELVFSAGNCHEPANMVAAATNALLRQGTSKKSAFDLNEFFEFHGSYLTTQCYHETASVTLSCLSKHAPTLLPVVRELLTDAAFPEKELDIFKQNSRQRLQVNLMKSDFVANRLIDATIYGEDHPYGRYSRFEDLDALSVDTLRQFYQKSYQSGEVVIFMAGRMPANMDQLMEETFGKLTWKPASHEYPMADAKAFNPEKKLQRITNDPNGVQGAIRLAQPFPSRSHPEYKEVQVLNLLFGGYFGSRLMSNIREEKGYTYGIYSYLQQQAGSTAWMVSTEAGRDVCEAAISEVWHEMEVLRNQPVDEEEMLLVRNYLLGAILGSLDGPFKSIGRWKGYILTGVNPQTYFYENIDIIKHITTERMQELANKYLHPEKFYDLVVV